MRVVKQHTKFGTATLCNDGYYHITSRTEGNNGKKLSRLIYQDYHGVTLLSGTHIHHIDGDKSNDSIDNLKLLSHSEHNRHHMIGEKNPFYGKRGINYGKTFSEETCKKISQKHADVSKENNPKWGTSAIEEWGGLWFLKEMKLQLKTMRKVEEYTGITPSMISKYLRVRGYRWSTITEQLESEQNV